MRESGLFTLAVVFLFVALLLPAANIASSGEESTQLESVVNETIEVNYSAAQAVDPSTEALSFEPNATVFNDTGAELVNETDYTWRPSNGTIAWVDTANTTDGESANVTYNYTGRDATARGGERVFSIFGGTVAGVLLLLAGLGATWRIALGRW